MVHEQWCILGISGERKLWYTILLRHCIILNGIFEGPSFLYLPKSLDSIFFTFTVKNDWPLDRWRPLANEWFILHFAIVMDFLSWTSDDNKTRQASGWFVLKVVSRTYVLELKIYHYNGKVVRASWHTTILDEYPISLGLKKWASWILVFTNNWSTTFTNCIF